MNIWFISAIRHLATESSLAKCKQGFCIENVFTRIMSGQVCGNESDAPGEKSVHFTVDTVRVFNAFDEKYLNCHSAEMRLTKRRTSFNRK